MHRKSVHIDMHTYIHPYRNQPDSDRTSQFLEYLQILLKTSMWENLFRLCRLSVLKDSNKCTILTISTLAHYHHICQYQHHNHHHNSVNAISTIAQIQRKECTFRGQTNVPARIIWVPCHRIQSCSYRKLAEFSCPLPLHWGSTGSTQQLFSGN